MTYRPGITVRRLRNRRLKRTENEIVRVFFEENECTTAEAVARQVGVARSTIYRHHHSVHEILPDYHRFAIRRYRRRVKKLFKSEGVGMRMLYRNLLLFILQNAEVMQILIQNGERAVVREMVEELVPKAERTMRLPKNSDKILRVYVEEVTEIIWIWLTSGGEVGEVERITGQIMELTETARVRLKMLLE